MIDGKLSVKLPKSGIVRSGFFRSSLRSALRPLEYTPLRAPGYIFFRSILRSAPSLGAEYRSAPTAPAVKKKIWWVLFGRRRGPKNFGVLFGRRRGRKIFRRTFWPPMVAKKFRIFKNCKKGRSGAKFAPLRHFVEYTPLRSARSPLEYTPLHAPAFPGLPEYTPLRSGVRSVQSLI